MRENKNWKNYIWTIPTIGIIFIIIGIFSPTAYISIMIAEEYFWMWGFTYRASIMGVPTTYEFFIYAYEMFIPSMICFVVMMICIIILIVLVKKEKSEPLSSQNSFIILGTLIILLIIAYMISMEIGFRLFYPRYYSTPYSYSFWGNYHASFGIIGPIFGCIFIIIGGIISKYSDKIDESIKKNKNKAQTSENKIDKFPTMEPPHKYCSNCGAELKGIFCSECGYKS